METLTISMLIVQGSEDFQVFADRDYILWQELLQNRKNVSFKLYENLNYMLAPSQGKKDVTEYLLPNSVSQEVIDDIAAWVTKN